MPEPISVFRLKTDLKNWTDLGFLDCELNFRQLKKHEKRLLSIFCEFRFWYRFWLSKALSLNRCWKKWFLELRNALESSWSSSRYFSKIYTALFQADNVTWFVPFRINELFTQLVKISDQDSTLVQIGPVKLFHPVRSNRSLDNLEWKIEKKKVSKELNQSERRVIKKTWSNGIRGK